MEPLAPVTARMRRSLGLVGADLAVEITRVIIADPAESLSFDDAGRGCDSRLGGRGRLAGAHAEEGKDRLTDAVRQQDARGQRRKNRTHQYRRITHRNIPQLSSATP
jgi:hypothetical protein